LVKYEALADELEEAYAAASQGQTDLPNYRLLVTERGHDPREDRPPSLA
jgi:hypothetical protein